MAFGADDAVVVATIVGTAIAIYELGHNITTQALAEQVGKRNVKITREIADLISEDEKFRAEITSAYNSKNSTLMTNILSTSPVGASFEHLRSQFKTLDSDYAKQNKILAERAAKYQKIQNTSSEAYARASASSYNYNDADKMSKQAMAELQELKMNSAAKQASEGGLKEGNN